MLNSAFSLDMAFLHFFNPDSNPAINDMLINLQGEDFYKSQKHRRYDAKLLHALEPIITPQSMLSHYVVLRAYWLIWLSADLGCFLATEL